MLEETAVEETHARKKRKICEYCSKAFSKTEHLNRHKRSHTKEKPFDCVQCGGSYGRYDSLLRHLRTQHGHESLPVERPPAAIPGDGEPAIAARGRDLQSAVTTSIFTPDPSLPASVILSRDTRHDEWHADTRANPLSMDEWLSFDNMDGLWSQWPFSMTDEPDFPPPMPIPFPSMKPSTDLRQSWYTHLDDTRHQSTTASPLPRSKQVDDEYRQSLQQKLHIHLGEQLLPSADYLNVCVKFYFKKFHPILPVIHAATFRPSKSNAVLLLSICSIGSLLTGHPLALNRGLQLFERLHKAIINNWETIMRQGSDEALAVVQAALLGQTFCLVSGKSNHLAQFDAFHGTVVSWARRIKVFQAQHVDVHGPNTNETVWREWARTEEKIRLALALRIHDAEISAILHHEPLSSKTVASRAQSDQIFHAASLSEWMALQRRTHEIFLPTPQALSESISTPSSRTFHLAETPANQPFNMYAALEDLSCTIMQARSDHGLDETFIDTIHKLLDVSRDNIFHLSTEEPLSGANILLWHYLHIILHTDVDMLEIAVGRNGPEIEHLQASNIQAWAISAGAQQAVMHASLIKDWLEGQAFAFEPAIHVPRIVFTAAIVLFCYRKYGLTTEDILLPAHDSEKLGISITVLFNQLRKKTAADMLCGTADLLPRIGHWPVSKRLAEILDLLVLGETS